MVDVVLSCITAVAVKSGKFGPYSSAVDWFCCWVWFALSFLRFMAGDVYRPILFLLKSVLPCSRYCLIGEHYLPALGYRHVAELIEILKRHRSAKRAVTGKSACVFDTVSSIYRCCTFRGPDSTVIFLEARLIKPLTGVSYSRLRKVALVARSKR